MMVGSRDHIGDSQDNILRPTLESLSTGEQRQFEDLMSQTREATKEKFLTRHTRLALEDHKARRDQPWSEKAEECHVIAYSLTYPLSRQRSNADAWPDASSVSHRTMPDESLSHRARHH
jgi:hypothetical protein